MLYISRDIDLAYRPKRRCPEARKLKVPSLVGIPTTRVQRVAQLSFQIEVKCRGLVTFDIKHLHFAIVTGEVTAET